MLLSEESIRKLISQIIETTNFGDFTLGASIQKGFTGGKVGGGETDDFFGKDESASSSFSDQPGSQFVNVGTGYKVDSAKLNPKANPERIQRLSAATGVPADFIYGIEFKESRHKTKVMAWNTHHYRRHSGDKSFYPHKKSVYGGEARRMYKEAYAKNPSAAVKAGAWGLYQVLGSWSLPRYGNDVRKWMSRWESDPVGHATDAFKDWVKHYQNKYGWIDIIKSGDPSQPIGPNHPYAKATKYYYGALKRDYYKVVINKASEWRSASSKRGSAPSTTSGTKASRTKGGKDSWKGRLGTEKRGGINFHKMKDGKNNYRAGIKGKHTNPTVDFFRELREVYRIQNVITLNGDRIGKLAADNAEKAGLKVFRHFIHESDMGNRSEFEKAKRMLKQGNTLIHCTHGADRTGAYIGRYYMEEMRPPWSFEKARDHTISFGGHKSGSNYKSARDFLQYGPSA